MSVCTTYYLNLFARGASLGAPGKQCGWLVLDDSSLRYGLTLASEPQLSEQGNFTFTQFTWDPKDPSRRPRPVLYFGASIVWGFIYNEAWPVNQPSKYPKYPWFKDGDVIFGTYTYTGETDPSKADVPFVAKLRHEW